MTNPNPISDVTVLSSLLGQTPFLVTMHSTPLGVDARLDWEREDNLHDFLGFYLENGKSVHLLHRGDCCEVVELLDMDFDIQKIVGQKLVVAEETWQKGLTDASDDNPYGESSTWSFYRFATEEAGHVVVRFFGQSNGYYSETVDVIDDLAGWDIVLEEKARIEKEKLEETDPILKTKIKSKPTFIM